MSAHDMHPRPISSCDYLLAEHNAETLIATFKVDIYGDVDILPECLIQLWIFADNGRVNKIEVVKFLDLREETPVAQEQNLTDDEPIEGRVGVLGTGEVDHYVVKELTEPLYGLVAQPGFKSKVTHRIGHIVFVEGIYPNLFHETHENVKLIPSGA